MKANELSLNDVNVEHKFMKLQRVIGITINYIDKQFNIVLDIKY